MERLLKSVLHKLSANTKSKTFVLWREEARSLCKHHVLMSKATNWWFKMKQAHAFSTWRESLDCRELEKRLVGRSIAHWNQSELALAWNSWREGAAVARAALGELAAMNPKERAAVLSEMPNGQAAAAEQALEALSPEELEAAALQAREDEAEANLSNPDRVGPDDALPNDPLHGKHSKLDHSSNLMADCYARSNIYIPD